MLGPPPQLTGTQRDMNENAVVVNETGVASEAMDKTTAHAPLGTPSKIPDLRELAMSYQPVTEEYTSGPYTLFTSPGDIYQYV